MLAEAECTWGCCGAIFVRIRRDGGDVVWDEWRNPDDPGLPLTAVRFDAAQYEAELARAHGTRFWEWPARTVARELRARLREESDVLGRWNSGFHGATSLPGTRGQIHLTFFAPPWDLIEDHRRRTGEVPDHTQFLARLPVTSEPAEVQAERIVAGLRADDPRASAEVCGGHTARR